MLAQIIDQVEHRKPSRLVRVFGILALACVVIAGFNWLTRLEWPGGMRSSYDVQDYDSRLTLEAKGAVPIIAAIQRYRDAHQGSLPANLEVLRSELPDPAHLRNDMASGWFYVLEDAKHFRLYHKLGWDPSLFYEASESETTWVFDPGDGRPMKQVKLNP